MCPRLAKFWAAGLSAISLAILCSVRPLHAQEVLVMQYNLEKALGEISSNTNAPAKALARIVNYLQPDVLLFNEVQSTTTVLSTEMALTDWVTNHVPYMGTQKNASFFIAVSTQGDGFNRNAAISLYPISNETTYNDGLRGLHAFRIQLPGTNLQIFHAHFKC